MGSWGKRKSRQHRQYLKLRNMKCPNCGSREISKDEYAPYSLYYCDRCFYKFRK